MHGPLVSPAIPLQPFHADMRTPARRGMECTTVNLLTSYVRANTVMLALPQRCQNDLQKP